MAGILSWGKNKKILLTPGELVWVSAAKLQKIFFSIVIPARFNTGGGFQSFAIAIPCYSLPFTLPGEC
jgi:hypothetical protein